MILTAEIIRNATGCSMDVAGTIMPLLLKLAVPNGVDTSVRMAHFLAQCAHESALFLKVEEDLHYRPATLTQVWPTRFYLPPDVPAAVINARHYTRLLATDYGMAPAALANVVYAGRNGNGDTASGDGWRYRGRGWLNLTFRDNYTAFHIAMPQYLAISLPDVCCTDEGAAASAAWFWRTHGCNESADTDNVEAVTRRINGGVIGLDQRQALTQRARVAFGIN